MSVFYFSIDIIVNAFYSNNRTELSVDGCSECRVKYHVAFQAGRDIFYILMPDIFNQGDQGNNEHPQSQKIGKR